MKSSFGLVLLVMLFSSRPVVAEREVGFEQCNDSVDNDFDGEIDCDEELCWSAKKCANDEGAPLFPSGPLVVGVSDEYSHFHFDAPDRPTTWQDVSSPVALFIGDVDGPGPQRDDLVVSRSAGFNVFKNVVTPGYISIPASPQAAQSLTPTPTPNAATFAVGDYNNDERLDVFSAVAGGKIAKFRGVGMGAFAADGAAFGSAGPMATQGRTLFVVSGLRRLVVAPR
jgi:hypothetical protein